MTHTTSAKLKYGGWGAALGAVVVMVLGFTWGGWITASTAGEMRAEAVLENRSEICAAQFMDTPDHESKAKAFMDTDSWKRREFVEAGGWDKMPGEETARGFVSVACSDQILAALEK